MLVNKTGNLKLTSLKIYIILGIHTSEGTLSNMSLQLPYWFNRGYFADADLLLFYINMCLYYGMQ